MIFVNAEELVRLDGLLGLLHSTALGLGDVGIVRVVSTAVPGGGFNLTGVIHAKVLLLALVYIKRVEPKISYCVLHRIVFDSPPFAFVHVCKRKPQISIVLFLRDVLHDMSFDRINMFRVFVVKRVFRPDMYRHGVSSCRQPTLKSPIQLVAISGYVQLHTQRPPQSKLNVLLSRRWNQSVAVLRCAKVALSDRLIDNWHQQIAFCLGVTIKLFR